MNKEIVFVFMFSVFWSALGIVSENMFASKKLLNKRGSMDSFCDQCIQSGIELEEDYKSLAILCTPKPGDYVVDMQDSYGDGWQGDGIRVTFAGGPKDGTVEYIDMLSTYSGGPACCTWTDHTQILTVPEGTEGFTWEYTGDSYPGEVSFQIYAPDGTQLLSVAAPGPGTLTILNCL